MSAAKEAMLNQVVNQCLAVQCFAARLAEVHGEKAIYLLRAHELGEDFVGHVGEVTRELMETLGEMVNNIDAGEDDDVRWAGVFTEAEAMFPTFQPGAAEQEGSH